MRPKVFATRRIPSPGIEMISHECDVTVYQGCRPSTGRSCLQASGG